MELVLYTSFGKFSIRPILQDIQIEFDFFKEDDYLDYYLINYNNVYKQGVIINGKLYVSKEKFIELQNEYGLLRRYVQG